MYVHIGPVLPRGALAGAALLWASAVASPAQDVVVTGEARVWHVTTLTFRGPQVLGEGALPNPFLDFRLDVTFTHEGGRQLVVPGYFAADGDAAESGADQGDRWRVHFVPDLDGRWTWQASFEGGPRAAVDPAAGGPLGFDGLQGTLDVLTTDRTPTHPRGRGSLRYVGERYLRFAGTGEAFLEAGPNSPENLLAYADFDGTVDRGGAVPNFLHSFAPHEADFDALGGGPLWRGDRGRGLLGALSYLSDQGMNSIYFITLTRHGDGDDVWPWRDDDDPWRFDCSKLDQWNRVFRHATERGIHLQMVLTETENEAYFEVRTGQTFFSDARRLYYRELVARFSHHLALTWNLGEENGWDDWSRSRYRAPNSDAQRRAFAAELSALDPYDHPVVLHTYHGPKPGEDQDGVYGPLLDPANPCFDVDGASLQGPFAPATSVLAPSDDALRNNHAKVRQWIDRSTAIGHPWIVGHHEQMPASVGTTVDGDWRDPGHDVLRQDVLWGTLMAGGAGVQYYFGYEYRTTSGDDLTCESFRSRTEVWRQSRAALDFFHEQLPFTGMECRDELVSDPDAYCLAKEGDVYAVYFRADTPASGRRLDIGAHGGSYEVRWFDPRAGGDLRLGSVTNFTSSGVVDVGAPPSEPERDWVVLVRRSLHVAGSGCDGGIELRASGPARLGAPVEVHLPGVPADAFPILVVGLPPNAPQAVSPAISCLPAQADCSVDVDAILFLPGSVSWRASVPQGRHLLGHALRVQGAVLRGPPTCVEATGAVELPFSR